MININGSCEANICRHCNNKCVSCAHASAWSKPYFMEPKQLKRDLSKLSQIVHYTHFHILGGEPLLHPELCEMLEIAKSSGISNEVGIITNGSLLPRMPDEFWIKPQYIHISAYPNLDVKVIEIAEEKSKEYGFFLRVNYYDTFWKQFDWQSQGESFNKCPLKNCCATVHDGFFYRCPQSAFFTDVFLGLPQSIDGLPIDDHLSENIFTDYMNRKDPFNACNICRPYGGEIKWHQCFDKTQWIIDSTH